MIDAPPAPDVDESLPSHAPNGHSQLKVSVRLIGPTEAQELIDASDFNRKHTKATVTKYALEMARGRWWENGQPIILNGEKMINGVHRSHAIIQSGVTLPFVVVQGVDPRANRTMDIGKPRTLDQMLELEGHHAPKQLAEAINWLIGYEKGQRLGAARKFTVLDKFDLFFKHPGLEVVAKEYTIRVPGKGLLNQGLYACAHYLFKQKSPEDAAEFMRQVVGGENLQKGDPAYTYREGVTHLAEIDSLKKTEAVKAKCANALVFGWNKFRVKEPWPKFRLIESTPEIQ
jgi:hypothetical protein